MGRNFGEGGGRSSKSSWIATSHHIGSEGESYLSDLIQEGRFLPPIPQVQSHPDDVILLPTSSGTTGVPKGVLITHRNVTHNLVILRSVISLPGLKLDAVA